MKLKDFIEAYKKEDKDKVGSVVFRRYIPISEKMQIIDNDDVEYVKQQLEIGNPSGLIKQKEIAKFFCVLLAYTDIKSVEKTEDVYDECMALGIDSFIISNIQKRDYERFCYMYDKVYETSDMYLFRNVIAQIGQTNIEDDVKDAMQELYKNKEILSNLNQIIGFNNTGIK